MRLRTDTRPGAAALELAAVLPLLMLIFAAALDFARVYHAAQVLESAALAGGLHASGTTWTPNATVSNAAAAREAILAEGASLDPPITAAQIDIVAGTQTVSVTIRYEFALIVPFLMPGQSVALERTRTFRRAPRPGD